MTKDEESSVDLVRVLEGIAAMEEQNSLMRFGVFEQKKRLPNGYTVRVTIRAPRSRKGEG